MESRRQGLRPKTPKSPKPSPSTNAERCKKYREKINACPERRKAYLERKKLDNQLYKVKKPELTNEQKEKRQEQNRTAQQRRRAILHAVTASPKGKGKDDHVGIPKTRKAAKAAEEKRHNACLRQQKRRAKMSSKEKQEENEKRMLRYYQKKDTMQQDEKQKTKKIRLASLLNGMYKQIKKSRTKLALVKLDLLKKIMARDAEKIQKEKRDFSKIYKRKQPKYLQKVTSFYNNESIDFPGQKNSTPKKVLTKNLNDLYEEFLQKRDNIKILLPTFKRRRPDDVLLNRSRKFLQCLCEKCTNIMLLMDVLNPFLRKKDDGSLGEKITHVDELVDKSLCEKCHESMYRKRV